MRITDNLPPTVDNFLADIAQFTGAFDYSDIINYANSATDADIKELREFIADADDIEFNEDNVEFQEFIASLTNKVKRV